MSTKLLHGDCLELMPNLPDNSVDMVLTDLPYGVTRNKWDSEIPMDKLWEQWLRIAKPDCSFILFGQGMFTAKLMFSKPDLWKYNLVWDKHLISDFLNANKRPLRIHEDIVVFQQGRPPYNPQMTTGQRLHTRKNYPAEGLGERKSFNNYGRIKVSRNLNPGSTEKYPESIVSFQKPHPAVANHPTEKPVNLLRWLIATYSNPGGTILDCTMGSGSTGVAAVMERREFIGIELEEKYFSLSQERIGDAETEMASRLF
jgi:site-specific DNA-methyltransferase (adenine-specific)